MMIASIVLYFLITSSILVPSRQIGVVKGPARIGCDAAHSLKCAFTNARWLATTTANASNSRPSLEDLFREINLKQHNYEVGFFPFVFDRETGICVAHGRDVGLVSLDLAGIFKKWNLGFSSPKALHQRFIRAAEKGGDWVRYLASDDVTISSKMSFVTNLTDRYYIGVGFQEDELPPDPSCTDKFDSWCSFNNVRSLVGQAQAHLNSADSLENFEAAMYDLSFDESFRIEGGFYVFMYDYSGRLKAHGILHDHFNSTLAKILEFSNIRVDGDALHQQFLRAAEGEMDGWTQYLWRNSAQDQAYTKIALIVKIEFGGKQFYLGAGFNHVRENLLAGPLASDECSANFNLPCASQNSLVLSSHALAHLLSSNELVDNAFQKITEGERFGFSSGDYYVFAYDYNNTCVAHGLEPKFVGKSLSQVFELVNLDLDGNALHKQFKEAAKVGGGWVRYRWLKPSVQDSEFEKVSFIFPVHLDGRSYYGGIGFDNQPFPISQHLTKGKKLNGESIPCSRQFEDDCSEKNTQSVVGQALTDLILQSTEGQAGVDQVLEDITNQRGYRYEIDDCDDDDDEFCSYSVMIFSYDSCANLANDNSGCCVADGNNFTRVGMSWQQILDDEGVASIRGSTLHGRLRDQADAGGGTVEDHFESGDQDRSSLEKKQIWASRFRAGKKMYYVAAVNILTPIPPTCDACPDGMECTRGGDSFCTDIPQRLPIISKPPFIAGMVALVVVTILFVYRRTKWQQKIKRKKEREEFQKRVQVLTEQMEHQMKGIRKVLHDMPSISLFPHQESPSVEDVETGPVEAPSKSLVGTWLWEEDASSVSAHKSTMVEEGTNFIHYSADVSKTLERSFKEWKENKGFSIVHLDLTNKITSTANGQKVVNQGTGYCYDVDFTTMKQQNCKSGYQRRIKRKEIEMDISGAKLPNVPSDIDDGNILPAIQGQILQVSKTHACGEWLWAIVIFDPLLNDVQTQEVSGNSSLDNALSSAIHDRAMSGWVPKSITEAANAQDLKGLLDNIGGVGMESLQVPEWWTSNVPGSDKGKLFPVSEGTKEYNDVKEFFMSALHQLRGKVRVKNIQRCENKALWQSYAVKKQTVRTRDLDQHQRHHNHGDIEKKWLFHGTKAETVPKIIVQGFNRTFAGQNAVAFGRGSYFARDASYSIHPTYAKRDGQNLQYIFLCRVVVGDWCQGSHDQPTPDGKPHNPLELFDSTVDNVLNPSIFVTFHDSSAYPEYLVTFESSQDIK